MLCTEVHPSTLGIWATVSSCLIFVSFWAPYQVRKYLSAKRAQGSFLVDDCVDRIINIAVGAALAHCVTHVIPFTQNVSDGLRHYLNVDKMVLATGILCTVIVDIFLLLSFPSHTVPYLNWRRGKTEPKDEVQRILLRRTVDRDATLRVSHLSYVQVVVLASVVVFLENFFAHNYLTKSKRPCGFALVHQMVLATTLGILPLRTPSLKFNRKLSSLLPLSMFLGTVVGVLLSCQDEALFNLLAASAWLSCGAFLCVLWGHFLLPMLSTSSGVYDACCGLGLYVGFMLQVHLACTIVNGDG